MPKIAYIEKTFRDDKLELIGMPNDNREAFEAAADELAACGYIVRIPHWDVRPGEKWPAAMRITLMAIIAQADGLAMLDGWERSEGAQLEAHVARSLMMPVKTVSQWAAQKRRARKAGAR